MIYGDHLEQKRGFMIYIGHVICIWRKEGPFPLLKHGTAAVADERFDLCLPYFLSIGYKFVILRSKISSELKHKEISWTQFNRS